MLVKQLKIKHDTIVKSLLVVLVATAFFNFFITFSFSNTYSEKLAEQKEANRPANIKLTKIIIDCDYCFGIDNIENQLTLSSNTNITSKTILTSKEAANLIDKYSIQKLPTLIVKGETDKPNAASLFAGWSGDNVKIYTEQTPPYYSTEEEKVVGEVTATIIHDGSCNNCYDINSSLRQIESGGIYFAKKNSVDYSSAEGKELVKQYKIGKIPAIIFNNQLQYYGTYSQIEQLSKKINDDLVMETPNPPYVETENNTVRGLIDIIYLVDNSCKDCYDVSVHKQILKGMDIDLNNETTIDISSKDGKDLTEKYNISAVPTTIISNEVGLYTGFGSVWSQVGEIINNTYVFTSTQFMAQQGKYKDLETGEIKGEN